MARQSDSCTNRTLVSVTAASLPLNAQLFHAGADGLEIVSSSDASHVSFPVGLVERFQSAPAVPIVLRFDSRDKFSAPPSLARCALLTPF